MQMESLTVHTVWGVGFDFRSFIGAYDLARMKMAELARLAKVPTLVETNLLKLVSLPSLTEVFGRDRATAVSWPVFSANVSVPVNMMTIGGRAGRSKPTSAEVKAVEEILRRHRVTGDYPTKETRDQYARVLGTVLEVAAAVGSDSSASALEQVRWSRRTTHWRGANTTVYDWRQFGVWAQILAVVGILGDLPIGLDTQDVKIVRSVALAEPVRRVMAVLRSNVPPDLQATLDFLVNLGHAWRDMDQLSSVREDLALRRRAAYHRVFLKTTDNMVKAWREAGLWAGIASALGIRADTPIGLHRRQSRPVGLTVPGSIRYSSSGCAACWPRLVSRRPSGCRVTCRCCWSCRSASSRHRPMTFRSSSTWWYARTWLSKVDGMRIALEVRKWKRGRVLTAIRSIVGIKDPLDEIGGASPFPLAHVEYRASGVQVWWVMALLGQHGLAVPSRLVDILHSLRALYVAGVRGVALEVADAFEHHGLPGWLVLRLVQSWRNPPPGQPPVWPALLADLGIDTDLAVGLDEQAGDPLGLPDDGVRASDGQVLAVAALLGLDGQVGTATLHTVLSMAMALAEARDFGVPLGVRAAFHYGGDAGEFHRLLRAWRADDGSGVSVWEAISDILGIDAELGVSPFNAWGEVDWTRPDNRVPAELWPYLQRLVEQNLPHAPREGELRRLLDVVAALGNLTYWLPDVSAVQVETVAASAGVSMAALEGLVAAARGALDGDATVWAWVLTALDVDGELRIALAGSGVESVRPSEFGDTGDPMVLDEADGGEADGEPEGSAGPVVRTGPVSTARVWVRSADPPGRTAFPVLVGPRFLPGWAVQDARPEWLLRAEPVVSQLSEVVGPHELLIRQLTETTTILKGARRGVVREVHVGSAAPMHSFSPGHATGEVGFLVTVPVASRSTAPPEARSPVQLLEMFVAAVGGPQMAVSRLRLVFGINRWNDPKVATSTAALVRELTEEVDQWQRMVDSVLPGVAVVVGHLVELGVRDGGGRLVDGDAIRELLASGAGRGIPFTLQFPHSAAREALVTSEVAWRFGQWLFAHSDEVFVHFGDADSVSPFNPEAGGVSVLSRFREEILASKGAGGSPSELVRIGGGYAHTPVEIDRPVSGLGYQPSYSAKVTVLLAEADNLHRGIMSTGRYHLGIFSERNTLINARYLVGLLPGLSPKRAANMSYPEIALPMNQVMHGMGVLTEQQSKFLTDPASRLVTSVSGERSTLDEKDLRPFLGSNGVVSFPGETLHNISHRLGRFSRLRKARNLTFRTNITRMLAEKVLGLADRQTLTSLLTPRLRAMVLRQLGEQDEHLIVDTRDKLLLAQKLNDRFEDLLSTGLEAPLEELLSQLRGYQSGPEPDWYIQETHPTPERATTTTAGTGHAPPQTLSTPSPAVSAWTVGRNGGQDGVPPPYHQWYSHELREEIAADRGRLDALLGGLNRGDQSLGRYVEGLLAEAEATLRTDPQPGLVMARDAVLAAFDTGVRDDLQKLYNAGLTQLSGVMRSRLVILLRQSKRLLQRAPMLTGALATLESQLGHRLTVAPSADDPSPFAGTGSGEGSRTGVVVSANLALMPQPGLPVERDAAFWVERLRADWARFEAEWQSHVGSAVLLVIGLDDARGGQVGRRVGPDGGCSPGRRTKPMMRCVSRRPRRRRSSCASRSCGRRWSR